MNDHEVFAPPHRFRQDQHSRTGEKKGNAPPFKGDRNTDVVHEMRSTLNRPISSDTVLNPAGAMRMTVSRDGRKITPVTPSSAVEIHFNDITSMLFFYSKIKKQHLNNA